jgi:hypothetical protein
VLGTIIRDTQIRVTKNAKEHTNYNHQGLGRKFRLARPLRASDASSDSPDPSGSRTQVPSRPIPSGLRRRTPLHQVNKTSTIRRPYPRSDKRDDSHTAAGQGADCSNHPGHCGLTSFTMQSYLFHCGVLPHSKKGAGEGQPASLSAIFSHY